ncbi:MAG TPA: trypsin-like peptidase domain-containing protein [Methylophilaceae bacterium]|nr:trypsin-like peptidase domain-containing protein [Methylophilaceae bacterium]
MNTKYIVIPLLLLNTAPVLAQPTQAQIFELNTSIVQVVVENREGNTGYGSGVVVNHDYVATNCHVLANAHGVSVNKVRDTYRPIALKADWKHDLCLLKFDDLPMKSIPMVDSSKLQYEQEVFSIGYPNDAQVPQPSFGNIKAIYPYDGAGIIRSSAEFAMGSSGGALFDQDFNLIGITTFKSPGRNGYYYSLPVEWIRQLFDSPDINNLVSTDDPFWSWPEEKRPYFMRVVIPYQKHRWTELQQVAKSWSMEEGSNADAWYYLAVAEYQLKDNQQAAVHLAKATSLNPRHLGALVQQGVLAAEAGNKAEAERINLVVNALDTDEGTSLKERIDKMQSVAQ